MLPPKQYKNISRIKGELIFWTPEFITIMIGHILTITRITTGTVIMIKTGTLWTPRIWFCPRAFRIPSYYIAFAIRLGITLWTSYFFFRLVFVAIRKLKRRWRSTRDVWVIA